MNNTDKLLLMCPTDKRAKIMENNHYEVTAAHPGVFKTLRLIQSRFFWPKMKNDVASYIRKCEVCQKFKVERKGKIGILQSKFRVMDCFRALAIDHLGPFPTSSAGNKYVLVAADYSSRYCFAFASKNNNTETVKRLLSENIFLKFGTAELVISETHKVFVSKSVKEFAALYNFKHKTITSYHPASNRCERSIQGLKTAISMYCSVIKEIGTNI